MRDILINLVHYLNNFKIKIKPLKDNYYYDRGVSKVDNHKKIKIEEDY